MSSAGIFDRFYREYDSWYSEHGAVYESEFRVIRAMGLSGRGLEIGVGTGVLARRLGVEVGLDPAVNMLLLARERGVETVAAVGESLPFRGRRFDYVLITISICFFDKPADVLREATRVLKLGGKLVVCVVPRDSAWGEHYIKLAEKGHRFYAKAKFYTLREVEEMLENAGFKVLEKRGCLGYLPSEPEGIEAPSDKVEGKGFVCISARPSFPEK